MCSKVPVAIAVILVVFAWPILDAQSSAITQDGIWHSAPPVVTISRAFERLSTREFFVLPHVGAQMWDRLVPGELHLGVGGGAIVDGPDQRQDAAGGASLAVAGLAERFVWGVAGAAYGNGSDSAGRGSIVAGRPVGTATLLGATIHATGGGISDPGVNLDVGVSHRFGLAFADRSATLHAALLEIGPETTDETFSPFIGLAFPVWSTDALRTNAAVAFQNRRSETYALSAAATVLVGRGISISASLPIYADEAWLSAGSSFFVTIRLGGRGGVAGGSYVGLSDDSGTVMAVDVDTAVGSRDETPPEIFAPGTVIPESVLYSSVLGRDNYDLSLQARDDRAIASLDIEVREDDGDLVQRRHFYPASLSWGSLSYTERLVSPLRRPNVTGALTWNGGPDTSDGTVRIIARATDDAGNSTTKEVATIRIDGTPPSIESEIELVDADGSLRSDGVVTPGGSARASVGVSGAASVDFAVVDEADRVVRSLVPDIDIDGRYLLSWNGTDHEGHWVSHGVYHLRGIAIDQAGNQSNWRSIPLTTRGRAAELEIEVSPIVLSAGEQSEQFTIRTALDPLLGLRDWRVRLLDRTGGVYASWSGIDLLPEEIGFELHEFLRDGSYFVHAEAEYLDGRTVSAESVAIVVDRTPPEARLAVGRTRLRQGTDDSVDVFLENGGDTARSEVRLTARGEVLRSVTTRELNATINYALVDDAGQFLEPGIYLLEALVADRYGNQALSEPVSIEILTGEVGARIGAARDTLSPNGDQIHDTATLFVAVGDPDNATRHQMTIYDEGGIARLTQSGSGAPPASLTWDGRDGTGVQVEDGRYRAVLAAVYSDGTEVRSGNVVLTVDTTVSAPVLAVDSALVSPDGDGRLDDLRYQIGSLDDDVDQAFLVIRDESRRVVFERPEMISSVNGWQSIGSAIANLVDGVHSVELRVSDRVGNTATAEPAYFEIITRPVSAYVSVSRPAFSPIRGEEMTVRTVVPDRSGLREWILEIRDEQSGARVVRLIGDATDPVPVFDWDGTRDDGREAADGTFVVHFAAEWEWGAAVSTESVPFALDSSGPQMAIRVSPERFSPDGDEINDQLVFDIEYVELTEAGYWYLEILDPRGRFFYDVGGEGEPPTQILWDGYARNGETVVSAETYTWKMETADRLGNTTVVEGAFDTDVLVERTERGYRVRIPGISFFPNSAQLEVTPDNSAVLDRVAEILARFPEYRVLIEGHAVNVSGTDREEQAELVPLSTSRAESVQDQLIERGVPARRLETAGRGGSVPLVAHNDVENRWKNRRVEFLLLR